jgi:hypothetical protein
MKRQFQVIEVRKMDDIEKQRELKKIRENPMYFIDKYTNLDLFWYQRLILKMIYSKPLVYAVSRGWNIR